MQRSIVSVLTILLCALGAAADETSTQPVETLTADDSPPPFFSGPVPRSAEIAGDATLHDVTSIGSRCWAVGERGVIVRSEDSGQTWSTRVLATDCSLRSVCFLTNQIGFVAGFEFDPFNRTSHGVILKTRDGGDTWHRLSQAVPLEPLVFLRYFDLENAVAVTASANSQEGSDVMRSSDGGATWQSLKSDAADSRFCFAAFTSPQDGIVVGHGNCYSAVVSQQVIALAPPQRTIRRVSGASLSHGGEGWIVGDGGFLLHSDNGGISWQPPSGKLSARLGDVCDFRTVDHDGATVCIAGSPGGIVLHSDDAGQTWSFRKLNGSLPIHRLKFIGSGHVVAIGALGTIHHSADNGRTWKTVRGQGHRTAVVSLISNPYHVSLGMQAAVNAEQGYRSVVVQASSSLAAGSGSVTAEETLQPAFAAVGTNDFTRDWMFATTQPMQNRVREDLLKTWERQTDSRVGELLPLRLARTIRIWRPDIVCVERQQSDDEVAALWLQAMPAALAIADGTDPRSRVLDGCGLLPWQVTRVVARLTDDDRSSLQFRPDELLPRLSTSTSLLTSAAHQRMAPAATGLTADRDASGIARYAVFNGATQSATPTNLFAGCAHAPGTDSRRLLTTASDSNRDLLAKIHQRNRTQQAALSGHIRSSRPPLALFAELKSMGRDLPPELALRQLIELAQLYGQVQNIEGEIAVLKEILERFPQSPHTAHAAEQLFQYYSSEEIRYVRRHTADITRQGSVIQQAARSLPGLQGISQLENAATDTVIPVNGVIKRPEVRKGTGTALGTQISRDSEAVNTLWDRHADAALAVLTSLAPERASSAEVRLRQAANLRRLGLYGENSTVLSQAVAGERPFALLATAEMQAVHGENLAPIPAINLPRSASKPLLDAVFSDDCWQNASEIQLKSSDSLDPSNSNCLIMMAWDADHIYLAGSVERVPDRTARFDPLADRRHDADHGTQDRISFAIDTDRDYTTAFHFTIDESGQTSERCWRIRDWDPEWYVASASDGDIWRFEAAIPQEAFLDRPIQEGTVWSVQIRRIVPGRLQQQLAVDQPADSAGHTNGFGLLRFIRNRN